MTASSINAGRATRSDDRLGPVGVKYRPAGIFTAAESAPTTREQAAPVPFDQAEVAWAVILPSGSTGGTLRLWRWVEFGRDGAPGTPGGYPAGAWYAEEDVIFTGGACFVHQYANGDPVLVTVASITGAPSGNGYKGARRLNKRV